MLLTDNKSVKVIQPGMTREGLELETLKFWEVRNFLLQETKFYLIAFMSIPPFQAELIVATEAIGTTKLFTALNSLLLLLQILVSQHCWMPTLTTQLTLLTHWLTKSCIASECHQI